MSDDYSVLLPDYVPANVIATGASMGEEIIKIVNNAPSQTALSDNYDFIDDQQVPRYMAPKKIEVRRYILKK